MAVDIDGVLESLGEVGPYQRRVYFLLCLPIIFVGTANLAYVFISANPNYRCLIPGCDDPKNPIYNEAFMNFTIPYIIHAQKYDTCNQYKRKNPISDISLPTCSEEDFTDEIEPCENGMLFDKSIYKSTVISEFNLTCSRDWEASADQSIFFAGMLFGAFLFGIIADVFGRRKTILGSLLLMAASGVGVGLAPNLVAFHAARFVNAFSSAGVFQTAFVLGLEFVGPNKRVMFGVVGQYFFAFGEVLLGLVAWGIRSWRILQLVISGPVVIFSFYYWVVPESIRWLQARGRHGQVVASLETIAKANKKTIPLHLLRHQLPDPELDDPDDDFSTLISRYHKVTVFDLVRSPIMLMRLTFLIFVWIATTLTYYGLSFNATELDSSNGSSDKPFINFVLVALVEIPGYTLAWLGMSYWGRKWSLVSSLILSGAACITAGYVVGFVPMLLIFLVGKCTITCAFAVIYVFTAEIFPTSVRNTILGTCSMFARVGGMLAPFTKNLKTIYLPFPLLLFGCLSVISGLLTLVMPETLGTKLPDTLNEALHLGKSRERPQVSSGIQAEQSQRLMTDEPLLTSGREQLASQEDSDDSQPLS